MQHPSGVPAHLLTCTDWCRHLYLLPCFLQAPGTPGTYNIYNGVLAQDTITIRNVVIGGPLTFQGKFGCAHSFTRCSYQSCYDTTTSCPTDYSGVLPMARGTCPGSGNGITAGWSFNVVGASAAPSALSVPEQVYRAGLIKQRIVSPTTAQGALGPCSWLTAAKLAAAATERGKPMYAS